jgi:hypothetical protein
MSNRNSKNYAIIGGKRMLKNQENVKHAVHFLLRDKKTGNCKTVVVETEYREPALLNKKSPSEKPKTYNQIIVGNKKLGIKGKVIKHVNN